MAVLCWTGGMVWHVLCCSGTAGAPSQQLMLAVQVPGAKPNSEGPGKLLLNHAYSIIDVQQTSNGLQLLRMSNPWLGGNWEGAWSINSPEWGKPENAGLAEELGYDFDDDGTFWISFWCACYPSWHPAPTMDQQPHDSSES